MTWNNINLAALQRSRHCLTAEARDLLDSYEAMRVAGFWRRVSAFARSPLRRQTLIGNLALLIGVVLKKV